MIHIQLNSHIQSGIRLVHMHVKHLKFNSEFLTINTTSVYIGTLEKGFKNTMHACVCMCPFVTTRLDKNWLFKQKQKNKTEESKESKTLK